MSTFSITKASAPTGRAGHELCKHGDANFCMIGGYNESGPLAEIWYYDTSIPWNNDSSNRWIEVMGGVLNKGPLPRVDFSACVLGNKIYLLGGMESDDKGNSLIYNDLWSFDLDSKQWCMVEEEAPVSERMGHVAIAIDDDHMIIHGGDCLGNIFNDTWLYTVSSASWQLINECNFNIGLGGDIPCGRSAHSACYMEENNTVVIFGGSAPIDGEFTHFNDFWVLDINAGYDNLKAWKWLQVQASTETNDEDEDNENEEEDDEDEAIFPSPRDMPSILPVSTEDGPKLLVLGGFGLKEVSEEQEQEQVEGGGGDKLSNTIETMDEDVVEIGYLGDIWMIGFDGVCTDIDSNLISFSKIESNDVITNTNTNTSTESSEITSTAIAWSNGGCKRGCKLVRTSNGANYSFGGFDGEHYCHNLELVELK
jgi:hypothetical protein